MSVADYVAKYPRRRQLLETVEKFWLEDARKPPGQLDSSLKKHTTLLNRLRSNLLVGPSDAIIKEIDGLTLAKYLEEIVAAVVEGASKGKGDPDVAVDIIAHLHTRLAPEFLPKVLPALLSVLSPPPPAASKDVDKEREKEDKERLGRQRVVLRIVSELALIRAWPEGAAKGAEELQKILKPLMNGDPQYLNMPVIASFLKFYGRIYLGPKSAKSAEPSNGNEDLPENVAELVPPATQKAFRDSFVAYFNGASKTLVKGQIRLLEQDKKNHEAYIKSGEIFEDRANAYERMTKAVERLTAGVQQLADLLDLAPPTLPTAASLSKSGLQIVESSSSFSVREGDGGGIWDDEEERNFYEDLVDLKELVPPGLLGVKEKKKAQNGIAEGEEHEDVADDSKEDAARLQVEEDIRRQLEQMEVGEPQPEVVEVTEPTLMERTGTSSTFKSEPADVVAEMESELSTNSLVLDTAEDPLQSGPAARLNALFAALPEANNREVVDKLAVEFAFLNSKAARNRLVKHLASVPNNRTDLLPHYARFTATLNPYVPDVAEGLFEALDEQLRYLQKKKAVRELDSFRLKNVRFYGELAKFKVAKPYTILHVLKVFLDDFRPNIENIANLLETCGRFLLRYEGTSETAKSMIELMRRKQGTSHLDSRHHLMLENAFYQCNPPERVAREVIELPPMHAFIQHLLHDVLMKRTLDKVLKLLRKLHWDDASVYGYLLQSFSEIWEIKYGNIPFAAALVYDLQRYHPEFPVAVVDQVLEDIRAGMEENIFKFNQRRIASVKYLGELYMYRVVSGTIIFDTLWSLISFGHPEGLPVPGRDSPIDAVTDFFRVRLVCTMLETCGMCFDKGSQKRKLDNFLTVFQLYVFCKVEIPMDVEFMLNDTFDAIRPKTPRLKSFQEAATAVDLLLASQQTAGVDEGDSDDGSEDEGGRHGGAEDEDETASNAPATVMDRDEDEEDDADLVVVIREPKRDEIDIEASADFDREFSKMLADTTDARRDRKNAPPIFDSAVPMIRRKVAEEETGRMQFSLLSKRGNKQHVRDIEIPMDSAIAVNSRTHQMQHKAEQEQLKKLVLQNERRQGHAELHAFEQDLRNKGFLVRRANG